MRGRREQGAGVSSEVLGAQDVICIWHILLEV